MKKFSLNAFLRSRFPLAICAGLLLAAAFPKIGIAGLAWIAPGLILAVALGKRGGEAFRIGYVAGLAHYLASLYWLLHIPVTGFPILGWIALSGFLALLPGTWVWLCVRVSVSGFRISDSEGARGDQFETRNLRLEPFLPQSWSRRVFWTLFCAASWVALEMIIARIFGGFPWNLLSASQYRILPLIQISSVTGAYGVSFLVAWTSVSLLCAVSAILARPQLRSAWLWEMILPLIAVTAVFGFGFRQLSTIPAPERELKVALIQPSIPQTMIWDSDNDLLRFQNLIELSEEAISEETDLVMWPEAAAPAFARWETNIAAAISAFVQRHGIWLILGSDDLGISEKQPSGKKPKYEYYNASFLVNPAGKFVERYRKRSLVMFGEYIPLEHSLPFIKWLTPVTGSFTPGDRAVPFSLDLRDRRPPAQPGSEADERAETVLGDPVRIKTSVLICFEDNFPHLVREYAEEDTDFLINLTNNGWFGESAAQWQHAANAIFRAVENGLPLVRCTNNGLTCWVDARGRMRGIFRDPNGTIYGRGSITVNIPLLGEGEKRPSTFYNQHGDWFGWSCAGFSLLVVLLTGTRRA